MPTNSSSGKTAFTPRWCATATRTAPVCTDCHNPHAVIKGAAAAVDQVPCKKCHNDIYTAYLGSVHGQSRLHQKDSYAPLCSGCHTAHSVQPISVGALAPGAGGRLFRLPCRRAASAREMAAQRSPAFPGRVLPGLPRARRAAHGRSHADRQPNDKARGTEQIGVPLFEASTNSDGKGIDAQTLWNLLQTLDRSGLAGKTVVRGRLEVASGPQMHQIADKSKAISECRTCHNARIEGLPERDHLAGRTGRPPRRLWRQCRRAQLRLLGRLGERLLCDRRHQDQASGYPADPRRLRRRRHRRRSRRP